MRRSVSFSRSRRVIPLFRFYDEQFAPVGRIAPAEMRTVHVERVRPLGRHDELALAAFPVYRIEHLHQALMLLCIGRSEERSLRLRSRGYFGEDDPGFLVSVAATVNLPQGRPCAADDLQRARRRFGQRHKTCFITLRPVVAVAVGIDIAADFAAYRPLAAQLLGAHGGELRDDALQRLLLAYLPGEAPRYGNLLLLGRHLLEGDALYALQLVPHAEPRNAHPGMYPLPGQLHELQGRSDTHAVEHFAVAAADAPDVAQRKGREHFLDVLLAVHVAAPVETRIAFGELRGDFC